ncbi:MAG: hypothetical protein IPL88_05820 [Rhizobiales bacterium]|nr:hypothetical protein [Hyphomicrobiales bacterium]
MRVRGLARLSAACRRAAPAALAAAALVAPALSTRAAAQVFVSPFYERFRYESALRPMEIAEAVRDQGYRPATRPWSNGEVYVVDAFDHGGRRVRLIVDAYEGVIVKRFMQAEPAPRRMAGVDRLEPPGRVGDPDVLPGVGPRLPSAPRIEQRPKPPRQARVPQKQDRPVEPRVETAPVAPPVAPPVLPAPPPAAAAPKPAPPIAAAPPPTVRTVPPAPAAVAPRAPAVIAPAPPGAPLPPPFATPAPPHPPRSGRPPPPRRRRRV